MVNSLSFSLHIINITRKAHARANLILKCFVSRDCATLLKAYVVYVRPLLEYCSSVWSPTLVQDINAVECVQRRFTKRLPGMGNLTYFQRLRKLGIESLESRRLRADLIIVYKILFGLTAVNPSDLFTLSRGTSKGLRGHKYKLERAKCRTNIVRHNFAFRIVPAWNNLPADTTNFNSLHSFKLSLKTSYIVQYCTVNFN